MKEHICICGDCAVDAYVDRCKFYARAQEAEATLRDLNYAALGGGLSGYMKSDLRERVETVIGHDDHCGCLGKPRSCVNGINEYGTTCQRCSVDTSLAEWRKTTDAMTAGRE